MPTGGDAIASLLSNQWSKQFGMELDIQDKLYPEIFHVSDTDMLVEDVLGWEGYEQTSPRLPGEGITLGSLKPDFEKRWVQMFRSLGDVIPDEYLRADPYHFITKHTAARGGDMARSFVVSKDVEAGLFLSNFVISSRAADTGVTSNVAGSPDNCYMVSSAHPRSKSTPGTTQSNRVQNSGGTADLDISYTALDAARKLMMNQLAADGYSVVPAWKNLKAVFNPNWTETWIQLVRNDRGQHFNANFAVNTFNGKIDMVPNPYFKKSGLAGGTTYGAWLLFNEDHSLQWKDWEQPTFKTDTILYIRSTLTAGFAAYAMGWETWRNMVGSVGA